MGLENILCNYNGALEILGVDFISCDRVLWKICYPASVLAIAINRYEHDRRRRI